MGPRDEPELSRDDGGLAADEAATRALLARFSEPAPVAPPPGLEARLLAGLPRGAPPRPAAHPWRRAAAWAAAAAAALLLALGAWGVLINSLGPARVAGGPADGLGQLVLVLTLAAKPLVNLLADAGLAAALAVVTFAAAAWLWWRLVRGAPLAAPAEAPR
jgi:hypothetical protein